MSIYIKLFKFMNMNLFHYRYCKSPIYLFASNCKQHHFIYNQNILTSTWHIQNPAKIKFHTYWIQAIELLYQFKNTRFLFFSTLLINIQTDMIILFWLLNFVFNSSKIQNYEPSSFNYRKFDLWHHVIIVNDILLK